MTLDELVQLREGWEPGSSPHSAGRSPHSAGSSPHSPGQQADIVRRVANSKRASPEEIRAAILVLCEREFFTVAEIAGALKRRSVTIQQNYVSRMTQEGVLEARYPDVRNHPAQAYRTVRSMNGGQVPE